MSIRLHWYLPTIGDRREIVGAGDDSQLAVGPSASRIRPPTIAYLGEIARTAEPLGFESVLTPTGSWCEDAWIRRPFEDAARARFGVHRRPLMRGASFKS
jgi:alkanesulfonate monooxygenase